MKSAQIPFFRRVNPGKTVDPPALCWLAVMMSCCRAGDFDISAAKEKLSSDLYWRLRLPSGAAVAQLAGCRSCPVADLFVRRPFHCHFIKCIGRLSVGSQVQCRRPYTRPIHRDTIIQRRRSYKMYWTGIRKPVQR